MPMTKIENEQLTTMFRQLVDEREILVRENEYLKAKLNESILMETIKEMKKERDLLFKLLSNLTINNNNKEEQFRSIKHPNLFSSPSHPSLIDYKQNFILSRPHPSTTINHIRLHRSKTNNEPHSTVVYRTETTSKHPQINKTIPPAHQPTAEPNKIIRKHDIQLKHSQNSPFQHYRSQSLQNLT